MSARLASSQLFSGLKPAPKKGSRRQSNSKRPPRFPQRRSDTEKLLHTASFCTEKLVHTEAFTQRQGSFHTETGKLLLTASFCAEQAGLYTETFYIDIEKLLHAASFYTQRLLHTEVFTQRSFYIKKPLRSGAFTHSKLLHAASVHTKEATTQKVCAQRSFSHTGSFYTQKLYREKILHTEACTQRSPYTEKLLHTEAFIYTQQAFTQRSPYTETQAFSHNGARNCSSKTGWISAPKPQTRRFQALFKRNFTRKIISAKTEKIC